MRYLPASSASTLGFVPGFELSKQPLHHLQAWPSSLSVSSIYGRATQLSQAHTLDRCEILTISPLKLQRLGVARAGLCLESNERGTHALREQPARF